MKILKKYLFIFIILFLFSCRTPYSGSNSATGNTDSEDSKRSPYYDGTSQDIGNLKIFPDTNPWNYRIDNTSIYPTHPDSNAIISIIGVNTHVHPDFGNNTYEGRYIGIPYIVISDISPIAVNITFQYASESDPDPYIIPDNAPIEGQGPNIVAPPSGDRHVIVINKATNMLYEIFRGEWLGPSKWRAGSGAKYDLTSTNLRPDYWTSADAAGLPIFPYLVRYEEIQKGEIKHAIRFTLRNSIVRDAFIEPATHAANWSTNLLHLPMGARLRLKASFDISSFSTTNQIILTAMKRYGLILADNGSDMFISGSPDPRWDSEELIMQLKANLTAGDFEVVYFNEADVVYMP